MSVRFLSFIFVLVFTLSFQLHAAGRGAGVLPIFDDGTVLLGKETRFSNKLKRNIHVWSDFGGAVDPKDKGNIAVTALREANEETAKTLKLTYNQVVNSPYTDHNHPTGGSYRMYFVKVHGQKPLLANFHKNAKKLNWRNVEKSDWKYVSAQHLLNAVNAFSYTAICPGTNEEIFAPTRAGLKQGTAQSVLRNLINSAKNKPASVAKKTSSNSSTVKKKVVAKRRPVHVVKNKKSAPVAKKASSKNSTVKKKVTARKRPAPTVKRALPFGKKTTVKKVVAKKNVTPKKNTKKNKRIIIQRRRSRR